MERLFIAALSICLMVAILLIAIPFYWQQKRYQHQSKYFYFFLIIVVPLVAVAMYAYLGHFSLQRHAWLTDAFVEQMKSPEQVIEKLKQRLQQEPKSSEGWYLLGRLYLSQGQNQKAQAAFAKALELAPNNPIILNNYAVANYLNHNYQEAIHAWQKVLKIIPADSEDAKFVKQAIEKARAEIKSSK